jgi:tyrosinase
VLVFLGNVDSDAREWVTSDTLVGTASTLGAMIKSDQVTPITINLSVALEKAIAAGLTTTVNAKEYLKKNLHYRLELVRALIYNPCERSGRLT